MNTQDKLTNYTNRCLARVVIEAETPLKVGTGESNLLTDAVIATDANGLPYIPGTAIAGILRHTLVDDLAKRIFGFHELSEERKIRLKGEKDVSKVPTDLSKGSEIIFTEARMIGEEGKVMDGLQCIDWESKFYFHFNCLPIRQHVRINEKGVACKGAKFDEQVVFKGTRFCFEIELLCEGEKAEGDDRDTPEGIKVFQDLLGKLQSETLYIGGGTRRGFGKFKVVETACRILDLRNEEQRFAYICKTSELNDNFFEQGRGEKIKSGNNKEWIKYELELVPENFFLFGAGIGDKEADTIPVTELCIVWEKGKPEFIGVNELKNILVPASSVKGALAHRVAFYWNQLDGRFAENKEEEKRGLVGNANPAVVALFGAEGEGVNGQGQKCGSVIFSDIIYPSIERQAEKLFNHVAIDRFTGGTIKGALFSEKVICGNHGKLPSLSVFVDSLVKDKILEAWELALMDLAGGMLPLGGAVNHGYGVFTGRVIKNQEVIYDYEKSEAKRS